MVPWPIRIHLKSPKRGDDAAIIKARLEAEFAQKVEEYVNSRVQPSETKQFDYGDIARGLGADKAGIKRLLKPIHYDDNGITVFRKVGT